MSDLIDTIAAAICKHNPNDGWEWQGYTEEVGGSWYWHEESYRDQARAALAAVRAALLTPEVVDAGAKSIVADPNFGNNRWTDDARNVLTAALDAAGLVDKTP